MKEDLRLLGVELYFEDLPAAKRFYCETLGLKLLEEDRDRYLKLETGAGAFLCLERKGSENYRSRGKAVLFFEVQDLAGLVRSLGPSRVVRHEPGKWAVIEDPEGHNVLFLGRGTPKG